jgi:glutamine phosphoribosylpyrophosphate amidotransferase
MRVSGSTDGALEFDLVSGLPATGERAAAAAAAEVGCASEAGFRGSLARTRRRAGGMRDP